MSRTAFGRDLRASAADPSAATTLGVDVRRVQMLTFALGAACAGVGGVLIGAAFQFGPSSGAAYLLNSLAIVVLGGLGNVLGTLVGGIVLGALQSLGGLALGDGYRDLVGMALFLAVLAFRPGGVLGGGARMIALSQLRRHTPKSGSSSPPSRCSGSRRSLLGDYWQQIGFRTLIYLTLAEGWNLMAGSAGLVSLGVSCFVGLGAYVAFGLLNAFGLPLPLVLCASALAGAALACLVSPALFRLRGLYFTVGTLALAELLRLIMVNVSAFGGATGIS